MWSGPKAGSVNGLFSGTFIAVGTIALQKKTVNPFGMSRLHPIKGGICTRM
jgi:hypothetical protein